MTHYQTLGVEPTATDDEIRKVWHSIARLHHSDYVQTDATQDEDQTYWDSVQQAYDAIKTPEKRAAYDAKLRLLSRPCKVCGGTGKEQIRTGWDIKEVKCTRCNGTGRTLEGSAIYSSVTEL